MSEKETDQSLQFEKAEFDAAAAPATCHICSKTLTGSYFTVNMQSACENCAGNVRASLNRKSTFADVFKSIAFGIGAGIAGSLVYYAVLKFTGYEIGLIAILVGFLVGKAVMIGSGHRGGIKYRAIAVLITYIAIVSTYVPLILDEVKKHHAATAVNPASPVPATGGKTTAEIKPAPAAPPQEPPTLGEALSTLAVFAGYMLILPFLAGASNIIGLIIIAFALFEAARHTAKPKIAVAGPFEITAQTADA